LGRFVDLHLNNPENPSEVFKFLGLLGYGMVAVSLPEKSFTQFEDYRRFGKEFGVDVVSRVDLTPTSTRELLQKLRSLRGKFELIGVVCESKSILRVAVRDGRVDLVLLSPSKLNLFGEVEARFASNSNATLEVCFTSFLRISDRIAVRVFSMLHKVVGLAKRFGLPLVVSSGAKNVYGVKAPRDLAAFIQLFGLTREEALATVSTNPKKIVERNREKLDKSFVGVGVRVFCKEGGKIEDG
jgi:ribonuclease P/MRP protein subunit RPP1